MHKGSRFPYAFDFMMQDSKKFCSETVYSHDEVVQKADVKKAAHSGVMTRTSTH